ncbi:DUF1415 family protein [Paraferrimonas sedimenticola]|uniref:DUF1415 domain-containing protein n=1 Tax=Paraferrimonas sedimenticola TaxID=375674 RepID=A0AA37VXQ9_9GAMM|nr:DUF1415 domain-containing protein [Paraferrimonas sedimenticola]GLP96654.1 hypothetical protein GCM10007895_19600 [Paraferrimonas sedimenticola]
MTSTDSITTTKDWLLREVIGLNLCPFAKVPYDEQRIGYQVSDTDSIEPALSELVEAFLDLLDSDDIETSLLIYHQGFSDFDEFWELVGYAEDLMNLQGLDQVFQLAHFHPDYCFEGLNPDDPANQTNQSPLPTLHLIRHSSLEMAKRSGIDIDKIPDRNQELMRKRARHKDPDTKTKC